MGIVTKTWIVLDTVKWSQRIFRLSLLSLPYISYVCFPGLLFVMGAVAQRFRRLAVDRWIGCGLMGVSGLMVLSAWFAYNRGEALLHLWNFLPFFLLFSLLPFVLNRTEQLEKLALDIVLVSIPINLYALVQYIAKLRILPRDIRRFPLVLWLRQTPHRERALSVFDHPNTLASFLVLVLALGLGLIIKRSLDAQRSLPEAGPAYWIASRWLYAATYANLVGIFCSGSRNGVLIAVAQIITASILIKVNYKMFWVGLVGLGAIIVSILGMGLGGRSLSLNIFTQDPRLGIWKIGWTLMQERPWLGWGLGNFKFLYPERNDMGLPMVTHPHNFWLLMGCEVGVLAMVIMTLTIGYICFKAVWLLLDQGLSQSHNAILLGYLMAFGGCTLFSLFDVTFYDSRINIMNWFVLAGIYTFTQLSSAQGRSRLGLES
ncbi:MAG: O-antigen ligase family protein [Synechococcales cyanobacterium K32_A2020_035]|nr:O-antigen ligase family protein [Synechococcales cyanobacterium K32_A2020_035]